MTIKKLSIAVTFYYVEHRVQYLKKIATHFHSFAEEVEIHVFTNIKNDDISPSVAELVNQGRDLSVTVHTWTNGGNPEFLAWAHVEFFKNQLEQDNSITHYMYLEDDMYITPDNIEYWLEKREYLRDVKLLPSFLRYEQQEGTDDFRATEIWETESFETIPKLKQSENYYYLSFKVPYSAMYLFDQELLKEWLNSSSSVHTYNHPWGIREQAASGLSWVNVPEGFRSRHVIGYDYTNKKIDPRCLIHHTPNNYANMPGVIAGKIKINDLIY